MVKLAKPAPGVIAALLALVVIFLTLFGALEELPTELRGAVQALGTAGGIYLGYLLQARDADIRGQASASASQRQLLALAREVNSTIGFTADRREQLALSSTVAAVKQDADASLAGIDNSLRGILHHVQAAAENWGFEGASPSGSDNQQQDSVDGASTVAPASAAESRED
ncbi:hypothetical protein E8P82_02920 [Arthrobacter echini]|uniref:Uncharacterized protein n=1 Tax=Arthrobacter echini TaxID=1529066 RepID=A0A4S5E822_9MICC|nr:hypothetical protein [Arthrobacter echini]THJ67805.1 hypothetical protein E8P82_02920 [Arthrobacter echini]